MRLKRQPASIARATVTMTLRGSPGIVNAITTQQSATEPAVATYRAAVRTAWASCQASVSGWCCCSHRSDLRSGGGGCQAQGWQGASRP